MRHHACFRLQLSLARLAADRTRPYAARGGKAGVAWDFRSPPSGSALPQDAYVPESMLDSRGQDTAVDAHPPQITTGKDERRAGGAGRGRLGSRRMRVSSR